MRTKIARDIIVGDVWVRIDQNDPDVHFNKIVIKDVGYWIVDYVGSDGIEYSCTIDALETYFTKLQ
jgi:hypothetical protein